LAALLWSSDDKRTSANIGGTYGQTATNEPGIMYSIVVYARNILFISAPADYYAVTLGMNWKPAKRLRIGWKPIQKLNIRPNIRYDRADGIDMAFRPFDGRKDQFLFSLDATLPF
jgi:hypothetical protein